MTRAQENYNQLVDDFTRMLEQGVKPWQHPLINQSGGMPKRSNGEYYRGINVIALLVSQFQNGFTSQNWFTFKGAKELGAKVKKGSKGTQIFYVGSTTKETESGEEKTIHFLKSYAVFNADQIENLPERFAPITNGSPINDNKRDDTLDEYFSNTEALVVSINQGQCYYDRARDHINMPAMDRFKCSASYYATLAHEVVHWTGSKTRLNRTKGKRFGDNAYAFEELIAELGSAFIMSNHGAQPVDHENHASYLDAWVKALKNDRSLLRKAATDASAAVSFIDGLQGEPMAIAA